MPSDQVSRDASKIIGICILVGWTTIILLFALMNNGAYVYFFEPNPWVRTIEVLLCLIGIGLGGGLTIWEILEKY